MDPFRFDQTVHYNVAHAALPILALWSPQNFYDGAFSRGSIDYLRSIWCGVAGKMGSSDPPSGLESKVTSISRGVELLLVQMPFPKRPGETFYVACTASVSRSFFHRTVSSTRYFTLELGADSEPTYFVAEWKSPPPKADRENHGRLPHPDSTLFVSMIDAILRDPTCYALNAFGQKAGTVQQGEDGRCSIEAWSGKDLTSVMFSTALVMSHSLEELDPALKRIFSRWAEFPDAWTSFHREYFALAMMHYFHEAKADPMSAPPAVRQSIAGLPINSLPPLKKPLTPEVKRVFNAMFGA